VKLHDLKPAPGSRKDRTRVGRGIAAGKGKTAGRGTKGQKARAGASIPAWFEGGQTPIHIRLPKLRGFKRRFRIEYQVVNVGRLSEYAAAGRFGVELDSTPATTGRGKSAEQSVVTVNAEVLASAGLIGSTRRPVKILGQGDIDQKLFVLADAFTASARQKIEGAGGFVQLIAPPDEEAAAPAQEAPPPAEEAAEPPTPATAEAEPGPATTEAEPTEPPPAEGAEPPPAPRSRRKAERQE
jgi:large subunit ribosomal protein L15